MIEIRSYRAVFELERRIYRVDRLRLNPGGIPVRGVVYFLAILAASLIAGGLPLLGEAVRALPWYLRDLALPVASAALLSVIRIEGRPFHLAAYALLRYGVGARRLTGVRPCAPPGVCWRPEEIVMLPDGSDERLRRLRYTGPGAVLVTIAHERIERGRGPSLVARRLGWGRSLRLRELPGRRALSGGEVIALAAGARLEVRAAATARDGAGAGAARPGRVSPGRGSGRR